MFPGRHSYIPPAFQWAPCDSEVFVSECFSVGVLKNVSRDHINAREVTSHGIAAGLHFDDVPLASRLRQILSLLLFSLNRTSSGTAPHIALQTALPIHFVGIIHSPQISKHRGFVALLSQNELPISTLRYSTFQQRKEVLHLVLYICEAGPLNKAIQAEIVKPQFTLQIYISTKLVLLMSYLGEVNL